MFNIYYGYIKKIRKHGKIFFLEIFTEKKIIQSIVKKYKIFLKKTIVGIYGFYNNKDFIIIEICFYKKKINKKNFFNFIFRSNLLFFIRYFFFKLKYLELDSAIIDKFTKLGSKQFLIIDKEKKNNFYSLSQSPQKIKQYYMFNNINKYFQITKCFRNEDFRSNRIKEFIQIDIENSYTFFKILKKKIFFLIKSIFYYFFNKNSYNITIKYKYIKKFFFEKKNFKFPYLFKKIKLNNLFMYLFKTFYFFYLFIKNYYLKYKKYFFLITKKIIDLKICTKIEIIIRYLNIINLKKILIWIVNFMYFKNNKINHHHFSSYKNNFLKIIKSKSLSYDLIYNGVEIGGGSVRNINYKIYKKNLFLLNIKKSNFLKFFKTSLPQHCGIALGLERLISLFCNININKVILYKKYIKNINSIKINNI
ncbi:aspartyl-tRNA synthetase [Candidatus Carsonella ruddii CS isolate Thao2000]|uniref:Aspartyl-tRNA synthetase n=1 Tax=Candidatus Carsonella ruddii CS isolate Thao2000 TaxID=1202537 RepID=J7GTA0_CARRU|nr:amino acid--tRNA ligase-related protein [Candidatus Carsonella ruddii]AFP83749.1 aspartyl-tRNA synthetase [Candidatus Carsonella ruddii CS isolate Thao2000]